MRGLALVTFVLTGACATLLGLDDELPRASAGDAGATDAGIADARIVVDAGRTVNCASLGSPEPWLACADFEPDSSPVGWETNIVGVSIDPDAAGKNSERSFAVTGASDGGDAGIRRGYLQSTDLQLPLFVEMDIWVDSGGSSSSFSVLSMNVAGTGNTVQLELSAVAEGFQWRIEAVPGGLRAVGQNFSRRNWQHVEIQMETGRYLIRINGSEFPIAQDAGVIAAGAIAVVRAGFGAFQEPIGDWSGRIDNLVVRQR
jgi:hypothetical protein